MARGPKLSQKAQILASAQANRRGQPWDQARKQFRDSRLVCGPCLQTPVTQNLSAFLLRPQLCLLCLLHQLLFFLPRRTVGFLKFSLPTTCTPCTPDVRLPWVHADTSWASPTSLGPSALTFLVPMVRHRSHLLGHLSLPGTKMWIITGLRCTGPGPWHEGCAASCSGSLEACDPVFEGTPSSHGGLHMVWPGRSAKAVNKPCQRQACGPLAASPT